MAMSMSDSNGVDAVAYETVERATAESPAAVVIWLHGLGADGYDFEPVVPELAVAGGLRFVFPHAPIRPVTINAGYPMRAWYDITALDAAPPRDEAGLRASIEGVTRLIDRELAAGFPSRRVLVAGFSQGGSVAINAGLRYPRPLAGVVGLSTWLPMAGVLARERDPANAVTPVFLAHGSQDPVVPPAAGEAARDRLEGLGHEVSWHRYPMPHAVCPEELVTLRQWIEARLAE